MNPKVDNYLENLPKWQTELTLLRKLALACGLTEELKWGVPTYTHKGANIILLGNFKENCTISFLKGVLLHDSEKILDKPGENSQSARLIRFTSADEIVSLTPTIKAYIYEAIEVENAGLKVDLKKSTDLVYPEELLIAFAGNSAFKSAFEALTPGRQRAYNLFFSAAKQSKTRESRIEKYTQRILDGIGFNDCTCGLSKRLPSCDGSHKYA